MFESEGIEAHLLYHGEQAVATRRRQVGWQANSVDEMEVAVEDFLRGMGARAVAEYEIEGAYMTYGYSDDIDEYVYQDDEKVNVNIAFSYDEAEDVTRIYWGIPFVDKSF